MKKPVFVTEHIYHVYNRGVEKRDIFLDDKDYYRFVHSLYEFNDEGPVSNLNYYFDPKTKGIEKAPVKNPARPRELLVEVLVFTLMPNHFHLLLRQIKDNGIVKFMQKIGTGYTNYFNKRYERVGPLFQGRFKAMLVNEESHFIHLPHYIHTNPLKLNYRSSTSIEFLENYRWSSFPDYIGKRSFPSVTHRNFLLDIYGGEQKYREFTEERLKEPSIEVELR